MINQFIGRKHEISLLQKKYESKSSSLGMMYGRRRIGKSQLLKHFGEGKNFLFFEGIEGEPTAAQIDNFIKQFQDQVLEKDLTRIRHDSWTHVFDYLTEYLERNSNKKYFIVFDEFQWMAAGQGRLVALLKQYWDNKWGQLNVMLILCGSVAHFMFKKVVKS